MRTLIARFVVPATALMVGLAHGGVFEASQHSPPTKYQVTNLASLGGTVSRGNSINNRTWVAGYSNLSGNQSRHASMWANGSLLDAFCNTSVIVLCPAASSALTYAVMSQV